MIHVHHWTEDELQWIRDNHDKVSTKEGAARFGIKPWTYRNKRFAMGFKRERSHVGMVHMGTLESVTDPVIAYALGFIWADGHLKLIRRKDGDISSFSFVLATCEKDMLELLPLLRHLGDIPIRRVILKSTDCCRQPQLHLNCYDQAFGRFLYEHDYHVKSRVSPSKVLAHIPDQLHAAFWHGFFDGDGCLHISRKHYTAHLSFCGTAEQSWDDLTNRLDRLDVKWRKLDEQYQTKGGKMHRCSKIDLSLRTDIKKVMDYLHSGGVQGLQRKRDKVIELDQWLQDTIKHDRGRGKTNKTAKTVIRDDGKVYRSMRDAAKDIGCRPPSISHAISLGHRVRGFRFALSQAAPSAA